MNKPLNKIDFAGLNIQYQEYKSEIDSAISKVLTNSNYIMGSEVSELEHDLQKFTAAKNAIACSSGTDALLLALMALDIGPGDSVITTPFTFVASAEVIALLGAEVIFVDVNEKDFNIDVHRIEDSIKENTKAIIPVSLYGQPPDIDELVKISKDNNLSLIIDGAQSFGSRYKGETDSALGDISTTSFFPAKPLGCYGDGGAVFTNDDSISEKMRMLRVHGSEKRYKHKYVGLGARLDTIQAAVLNVKLSYYSNELNLRQSVAEKYNQLLSEIKGLKVPKIDKEKTSAWAQYTICADDRDKITARLSEEEIPFAIHYPTPLHLQECFSYLGYSEGSFEVSEFLSERVLSLPMNPFLKAEEIEYIGSVLSDI